MKSPYISSEKIVVQRQGFIKEIGEVIGESPVSLTVNGEVWLTFMCTPTDLDALAVGFLFNEKIIHSAQDIASLRICPGLDNVDIWLNFSVEKPQHLHRTSGCTGGVTYIDNTESDQETYVISKNGFKVSKKLIFQRLADLLDSQLLYNQTGGVHTSVLCNQEGILLTAEDVGRHNTLDKLAGKWVLEELSAENLILMTTGRISSEMLQKSHRIGAGIVVSRTSPTSLSLQMAMKYGITLIGYARRDRFTIYTHPERISFENMIPEGNFYQKPQLQD